MIAATIRVVCDGCGWWDERTEGRSKTEAVEKARAAGWTVGKVAICPVCQGKIVNPSVAP